MSLLFGLGIVFARNFFDAIYAIDGCTLSEKFDEKIRVFLYVDHTFFYIYMSQL